MYRRGKTELDKVDLKYRILYFTALIATISIAALINAIPNGANDFISQLPSLIAETAISIIVTLFIIEWALNDDKKKDRAHTYEALSNAICRIAYFATQTEGIAIWTNNEEEKHTRAQILEIVVTNTSNLRPVVSDAIRKIANRTYEEVEERRNALCQVRREEGPAISEETQKKWKDFRNLDNQVAVKHFKKIDRQLFEIRIVLIPRALTLSNSQKLNDALHRFGAHLRGYESILVATPERASTINLRDLLIESSNAYDAIMEEHQKVAPRDVVSL